MARIRPTLILRADIDEREYNEELVGMIKRSYAYIGASKITSHEPTAEDAENVLRYDIILHKPYWDKKDPEAAAQWDEVMPQWLHNMFYKVGSTIVFTNKEAQRNYMKPLYYSWTELKFGDNVVMAFKTREDCSLDDSYIGMVEQARTLMSDGMLGEDVAVIRVPSLASYEAQKAAIIEERRRKAEEEAAAAAAAAAEAEAAAAAAAAAEAEAKAAIDDIFDEEPEEAAPEAVEAPEAPAAEPEAEPEAEEAEVEEGEGEDVEGEELEEEPEPEEEPEIIIDHVNFTPDTTIWGIEYADGTVREFNSATGAFVE